ncbi:MAG: 4Fe-4S dicluster domain-containing protein [bacterium]|nr:4Fe-4S dicluster domain-containing protein [bacterium]
MPTMITDACINCGACLLSCPNNGIQAGEDRVVINAALCTECVGFFSSEQCAAVCPIDNACIRDPGNVITEEVLFERAKKIHAKSPTPPTLSPRTSRFRAANAPKWWERLIPSRKALPRSVAEPEFKDA